ncbi:MAG: hypothetical protein PVG93_02135, partial [Phycisphaerales bacterium]
MNCLTQNQKSSWLNTKSTTITVLLLLLFFSVVMVQSATAEDAVIIYIGDVGSVYDNDSGTTLNIPVGSAGVAAGNTIIVGFASRGAATYDPPVVTDDAGNTYSEAIHAITYQHGRSYIFYAHIDDALVNGDNITITTSSVQSRVAVAGEFSGLLDVDVLDQALENPTGSSTTEQGNNPTVGPTGTTSQANELIIGMIGTEDSSGDAGAGTWLNDFIDGPTIKTSGASYEWRVSMGYKMVSATGEFTAAKTYTNEPYWAASVATFKAEYTGPTYELTIAVDPNGGGTTNPNVGVHNYPADSVVDINAAANYGYAFDYWEGDVNDPYSASTTVTMDTNQVVTAHFIELPTYNLAMAVDPNDGGITDPNVGVHSYLENDIVEISAVANPGYVFNYWEGDVNDPCSAETTVTMDANQSVIAHFVESTTTGITLDGSVSSNTADDVSSINITHTTGTGTNRLMLVGVSWNSFNTARSISSVTFTYDTTPLSLTEVETAENSSGRKSSIWSLLDPPNGESGTVTVTFDGSVNYGIVAGAANFAGVDQATPLGTSNSATGNSSTQSVTLTGLDGDELVFDSLFLGGSSPVQAATVDASQTELWSDTAANTRGAASTEEASGSSVTMSWSTASSGQWALAAVSINPASVGTTYDLTM